jgi:hypothetical protein
MKGLVLLIPYHRKIPISKGLLTLGYCNIWYHRLCPTIIFFAIAIGTSIHDWGLSLGKRWWQIVLGGGFSCNEWEGWTCIYNEFFFLKKLGWGRGVWVLWFFFFLCDNTLMSHAIMNYLSFFWGGDDFCYYFI